MLEVPGGSPPAADVQGERPFRSGATPTLAAVVHYSLPQATKAGGGNGARNKRRLFEPGQEL
jgi:hypothetical protein